MFCHVVTGDQYVIDVAKVQALKYSVHETLECLCRILQTKRHVEKFSQPKRGDDSRLGYVVWVHGPGFGGSSGPGQSWRRLWRQLNPGYVVPGRDLVLLWHLIGENLRMAPRILAPFRGVRTIGYWIGG